MNYMNETPVQVSMATPKDIEELRKTYEEARIYKYSLGDKAWGTGPFTTKEIGEMVAQNNTYIIKINGEHAAGFQLTLKDSYAWGKEIGNDGQAGYIHLFVTRNTYRGQGLGEKIISWIGTHLHKLGRLYIRLDCSSDNRSLCAYYKAQGFEKIGEGKNSKDPTYIPALYQKKV